MFWIQASAGMTVAEMEIPHLSAELNLIQRSFNKE
jgi:hypothetical protein